MTDDCTTGRRMNDYKPMLVQRDGQPVDPPIPLADPCPDRGRMSDDEYTAAMTTWALHTLDALDRYDNCAIELHELLAALNGPARDRAARARGSRA